MNRMFVTLGVALTTIICALAFAWAAYWNGGSAVPEPAANLIGVRSGISGPGVAFKPVDVNSLQQTLARPLFVPGRRPPEVKAALPAAAPSLPAPPRANPLERYRMMGARITSSEQSALIGAPGSSRWISVGSDVDGWIVERIESDRIEFTAQSRRGELRLYPALVGR